MIDHNDADVLAAAASVGSLHADEALALHQHLEACPGCSRRAAEYMAAAGALTLSVDPVQPSPELRTRLMRAVYSEAIRTEGSPRATLWQRWLDRLPRGRGFAMAAGAAAGIVVGAASVGALTQGSQSATVAVALTGSGTASAAHGVVQFDRSTGTSTVLVTGLQAPSEMALGSGVYELWLIPSSGAPVAAGFLTRSPSGTWTAAMTGDITHYHEVAATNEPIGGSSAPTGQIVVEGTITS
ncbi:MAG: anti-sigma factor domain-containing protein [Candidatus Dormibacteria bacterium]